MPDPLSFTPLEPRRPWLLAGAVFLAAALALFWPILSGQFLAGPASDQYVAGYGFRLFGAEYFRSHGHIPLWNPYLFGGLPFVAAMHGDIFYPTAWLRWILPVDTAMNIGFAAHVVIAGLGMYALLRAFGTSWAGAVAGGLSYELTGIVASLVHPGHDGKLFVSALTPLLFLALLRAVRDNRTSAFGMTSILIGLALHGHPQMSYYLIVAAGLWGAYLAFLAPDRPGRDQLPRVISLALVAVGLGFGLYAIQALSFIQYIPFSPRAAGGPSGGWDYATAFSMPPGELASLVLPEFNGIADAYWGSNFFKLHTEYVGVLPVILALIGARDRTRRSVVLALAAIGGLFLLVALGRHTPFYRLWYEMMPMMKKVRAPGMAFFLVAFPLAALAGFGADRLLRGDVAPRSVAWMAGAMGAIGLLGMTGVLQAVAQGLAEEQMYPKALENAAALRMGSIRLLLLAVIVGAVMTAIARKRLAGATAVAALATLLTADLYSVDRHFFVFQPPAAQTFRDDELTAKLRQTPLPFRTLDLGVYQGSWLMAHGIPTLLGYHGNELRWFDELLGGKNQWRNLGDPALFDLFAVRYLISGQALQAPGWHLVLGPVPVTPGGQGYLYEADSAVAWARLLPAAAKVPETQLIPTLLDPRFPRDRVVLYPDTTSVSPRPLAGAPTSGPKPAAVRWEPGKMLIDLAGPVETDSYLVVSENWYPDWTATVDGRAVRTLRGQFALLTIPVPAGAKQVVLEFRSSAYTRGRLISVVALALSLALVGAPLLRLRHGTS